MPRLAVFTAGVLLLLAPLAARAQEEAPPGSTEIHVTSEHVRHIRDMTTAGLALTAINGAFVTVSHATYICIWSGNRPCAITYFTSAALWGTVYHVSVPLLLVAQMKSRVAIGKDRSDTLNVVGWLFYVLTSAGYVAAAGPAAFTILYANLALAAVHVVSVSLSVAAGHRALRNLARLGTEQTSSRPTILPVLSPVPGGASIGIGGVF